MKSITELRNAFQTHSAGLEHHRWNPDVVAAIWNKIRLIRTMPKRAGTYKKRLRGGAAYALQGADLNYAMTPGSVYPVASTVTVYDRFPIDPTVNPQVVSDLDVYFQSALNRGCGTEIAPAPQVPADMGSNKVGGRRKRTQKGGSAEETVVHHPYMGTPYPNAAHSLTFAWQGRESIPASADPTDTTWKYATDKPLEPIVTTTATALAPSQHLMRSWPTTGAPQPVPVATGGGRKSRRGYKGKSRKTYKNRKSYRARR